MKVLEQHPDGTRTILLEPGDRVRLVRVGRSDSWIAKVGEVGTVLRRDRPREVWDTAAGKYVVGPPSSIDFMNVQTDRMKAGGWGSLHVAPWDVEYVEAEQGTTGDATRTA